MKQTLRSPSRLDNPFATCWTRPGAIAFHFTGDTNAASLVAKLTAQGGWGAIIGPHGSGKSTLLHALKPALEAAGFKICAISLRDRQSKLPRAFLDGLLDCDLKSTVAVDGYEQLTWLERWRLLRMVRSAKAGLVVAAHRPTTLPTLLTLSPDLALIDELVGELCAKVSTPLTFDDIAASHACHGNNVREIFFDLYDRHEHRHRSAASLRP